MVAELTRGMHAIIVSAQGGPEVLEYVEHPDPTPGDGEIVIDVAASGVNFIDIYHRSGAYPLNLPTSIGSEGAGTVSAVGAGVRDVSVGDTVAWANALGSYAEKAVIPAGRAVPVPEGVSAEVAAAAMLQGMTAHYLTHSTHEVKEGDQVLVHAGAGGMGQLLIQLAKLKGAKVYATVSTAEKEKLAREAGADEVLGYDGFAEALRGKIDVVYDGVGKATFDGGLEVLRPDAQQEGLALPHQAHAHPPHRRARGAAATRLRPVRLDRGRAAPDQRLAPLPPGGRAAGP